MLFRSERRASNQAEAQQRADLRRAARDRASVSDVRSKFRSIETRMQDLEKNITSKEWQLRRDFRDLED